MPDPVLTKTELVKVAIGPDMSQQIALTADEKGALGYVLASSFELEGHVVLIFQLPPS